MPKRLPDLIGAFALLALVISGCSSGQPSGRPDLDAIPEADRRAAATKAELYEFRAKVKKRGVNAAKQELPNLLGPLELYEKLPLGPHKPTYKQILDKMKELEGVLAGSPTKDAVLKVVEEVCKLADTLPGKADPNPQVE